MDASIHGRGGAGGSVSSPRPAATAPCLYLQQTDASLNIVYIRVNKNIYVKSHYVIENGAFYKSIFPVRTLLTNITTLSTESRRHLILSRISGFGAKLTENFWDSNPVSRLSPSLQGSQATNPNG